MKVTKIDGLSHKKFEENHNLGFTLLSDEQLDTIKAYDVWKEKKNYGRTYMGIERTTYLIDEKGMDYIQSVIDKNDAIEASKLMRSFLSN